ncbi:MAG TPA: DsbA family protein, partial [Candidatus Acidoferrales bacterium]|nr:DsbA family protein [Candidatus Acidoferrales bacterium]
RRGAYMWRDIERLATKYELPFQRPSAFPRASTLAARIACSIADEVWAGEFIRRVFVANFGENLDIGDADELARILTQLGQPAQTTIDLALGEHKERLRANTGHAIEIGIFGAPNCVANGELFWGEEALEDAIGWLKSHPDAAAPAAPRTNR